MTRYLNWQFFFSRKFLITLLGMIEKTFFRITRRLVIFFLYYATASINKSETYNKHLWPVKIAAADGPWRIGARERMVSGCRRDRLGRHPRADSLDVTCAGIRVDHNSIAQTYTIPRVYGLEGSWSTAVDKGDWEERVRQIRGSIETVSIPDNEKGRVSSGRGYYRLNACSKRRREQWNISLSV